MTLSRLCDVYIARQVPGRGVRAALSSVMVEALCSLGVRRFTLSTVDAHKIHLDVGFVPCPDLQNLMMLHT